MTTPAKTLDEIAQAASLITESVLTRLVSERSSAYAKGFRDGLNWVMGIDEDGGFSKTIEDIKSFVESQNAT